MSGNLNPGEPHPSAVFALEWLRDLDLLMWRESLASNAIEGNRSAEICLETLRRLLENEPVSDRYLLGLAWFIKDCKEII